MSELWRQVNGFEGCYEVSSLGRVRSLARRGAARNLIRERILKSRPHTNGYLRVALCKPGAKSKDGFIHRLVLESFVGPCPPDYEACHNDGDRQHNALSNLRWDTRFANSADRKRHGTQPLGAKHYMVRLPELVRRGTKSNFSVLNESSVAQIRALVITGLTHAVVAKQFGVTRECIGLVARRKTWRHVP